MEYFTEQALTYSECLRKIHAKYGERAKILMHKNIRMGGFLGLFGREGVELTGFIPNNTGKNFSSLTGTSGPGLSNVTGSTGAAGSLNVTGSAGAPRKIADFEEEKKKIIAAAGRGDPTIQLVLKEVQTIREKIDTNAGAAGRGEEHPSLDRIREILDLNDFSPSYSGGILDRIKKECSLDELNNYDTLQDRVLEWIGESITLYHEKKQRPSSPRIMVLVGPTGVGKTTTIAKLAAIFGIRNAGRNPLSVRLITIDAFRIGAKAQLEAYGNIMELPVSYVHDHDELKKTIAMYSEGVDLILVDTIGNSPRDSVKLGEMKLLLDACGSRAEVHLALAATTKSGDLKEILRQFEPFDYRSVLITKLDETIRVGNVISALAERGKSISYITDGQKVPQDIKKAQVVHFLTNLEGFRVNRAKIEKRFPEDITEQIHWR
ncbi:MAG: flagellar biosynthesis protein FlhF [Treponema sp.]|jgi:flagellar biosynthesis protein FlhF|nr:flagellar biosynthesis protein FlhF [Treponema sp.]